MRHALFILLLTCAAPCAAKGRYWSYTMHGTAYDMTTKDVLRNATLMIGEHVVVTDSLGRYSVLISGITCDRGASRTEIERCNDEAFDVLLIRRAFGEVIVTIRSHWRKHAFCEGGIVPCTVQRRDLFVP
jgi:hypothetical protein